MPSLTEYATRLTRRASHRSILPLRLAGGVFLFLLLTACQPRPAPTPFVPPPPAETAPAQPAQSPPPSPTLLQIALPSATPPPRPSPTPEEPTPTLPPPCFSSLRYVSDLTYPDGTVVAPGERLAKQWQVENDGTCDWGPGYRLKLVGGFPLGVFGEVALYPARAGSQAVLEILFTAPLEPGPYRTVWQAFDPDGNPFGDVVYMDIVVR